MKKKFLFDITLNVISSALPILVLQLLVLPLIAKQVGQDDYGLIISLVSVAYILSQPFGSVMNNLRLLKHEEYKKENIRGDFNYIIIRLIILNLVFVIFATIIVSPVFSILNIVLMIVFSTLFLLQNYYIVEYRIHLNFWKILLLNILLVIGYVIGLAFFLKGLSWQVIYIVGLLFVLVFLFFKGKLIREPINKTKKFKETRKDFGILFGSVFLKSSIQHIDKIILLFLLGTSYVSIYYTATFPSKAIALLITPISMVMLSYLRTMKEFNTRNLNLLIIGLISVGVIGYLLIILLGPYFLSIFYPDWASESQKLLSVTGLAAIMTLVNGFINPIILRFRSMKWQFVINLTLFVSNLLFSLTLGLLFGLYGFAIGVLIAQSIALLMKLYVFKFTKSI